MHKIKFRKKLNLFSSEKCE